MGAVAGPFDAWLTLRGLKTLGVRMDRHCDNAERIVDVPRRRTRRSTQVLYPGLPDAPRPRDRGQADARLRRHGVVPRRRRRGGGARGLRTAPSCSSLAESLGGVESLIEHPGRMTHASVAGSALEVPDDLVRLSVGIETVDDLLADLDRALG